MGMRRRHHSLGQLHSEPGIACRRHSPHYTHPTRPTQILHMPLAQNTHLCCRCGSQTDRRRHPRHAKLGMKRRVSVAVCRRHMSPCTRPTQTMGPPHTVLARRYRKRPCRLGRCLCPHWQRSTRQCRFGTDLGTLASNSRMLQCWSTCPRRRPLAQSSQDTRLRHFRRRQERDGDAVAHRHRMHRSMRTIVSMLQPHNQPPLYSERNREHTTTCTHTQAQQDRQLTWAAEFTTRNVFNECRA